MAEAIKCATREAYGKALVELGEQNDKVLVLDADLAAATKTGMFKKAFPERFIDVGIAESNLRALRRDLPPRGTSCLQARLPCSRRAERLSRCAIPSDTRT